MTYQEAYQKATGELKAAGIPEPESDAWILLEHVTGMTRTRYYVDGFERMPKNEEDRFFELVSCRKTRIPVQHLTGVRNLWDMNLQSMNMYLCQDRILRFL